jgi:hypothetical protein
MTRMRKKLTPGQDGVAAKESLDPLLREKNLPTDPGDRYFPLPGELIDFILAAAEPRLGFGMGEEEGHGLPPRLSLAAAFQELLDLIDCLKTGLRLSVKEFPYGQRVPIKERSYFPYRKVFFAHIRPELFFQLVHDKCLVVII